MSGTLEGNLDLYSVLGLNTSCTTEQVRQKYAELSKIYHPDKATSRDQRELNTKIFQHITTAYKTLVNDKRRQEYTQLLQSRFSDLKGSYNSGSLETGGAPDFNLDQFNSQFEQKFDETTRKQLESLATEPTDPQQATSQVEMLLAHRQHDDTTPVTMLEQKINTGETYNELDAMYDKVKRYAEGRPTLLKTPATQYTDQATDQVDGERCNLQRKCATLSSDLLSAIGNIRDNFGSNPVLLIELIHLFTKIEDIQLQEIGLNRNFIDKLQGQLDYQAFDSDSGGHACEIAAFETGNIYGAPVDGPNRITDVLTNTNDPDTVFGSGTLL